MKVLKTLNASYVNVNHIVAIRVDPTNFKGVHSVTLLDSNNRTYNLGEFDSKEQAQNYFLGIKDKINLEIIEEW